MKTLFLGIIGLLVLAYPAMAVDPIQIAAENCGWDMAAGETLSCGMTPTYSCEISDNTGATQIRTVIYTLGGVDYEATRTSGTVINGTWEVTVTATTDLHNQGGNYWADGVWVQNAAFEVCEGPAVENSEVNCGPNNIQCQTATGCFMSFNANQYMEHACSCEFTATEQCGVDNVLTTFYTPGFGCSAEQEAYQTTGVCDYCDPGWVADSFECNINRSEGDGFTGTTIVTYQPSDAGACCLATGLASDCQAPSLDNQEITCNQGYWLSEYNDVSSTRKNAGEKIFADSYSTLTEPLTSLELYGWVTQRQLQPIVFDIDDDGVVETLTFTNPAAGDGTITAFDPVFNEEWTYSINRTILGDPGLFEFDARQGLSAGYVAGTHGAGLAVITDGGNNHMQMFRFQNGSLEELFDVSLSDDDGDTFGEASSVFCDQFYCYTVVGGNTLVQVDSAVGSVDKIKFPGALDIADGSWRNMPAKVPDFFSALSDIIVAKGFNSAGRVAIFACDTSTESCAEWDLGTTDPANVTEIYIGPRVSDGSQFHSPVYVVTMDNRIHYRVNYILHSDTPSWSNSRGTTKDNVGVDPLCPISPAAAECPAEGVFFASTWEPATASTTILEEINIPFHWTDEEHNSFGYLGTEGIYSDPVPYTTGTTSLPYGATSNADVAMQICSDDVCYQIAGITGHYTLNVYDWTVADFYVSENGGTWTPMTNDPFLGRHKVGDNAVTSDQYDDCYISDNYLAWGAVDGDLFVVRTTTTEAGGVGVGALDDPGNQGCSSVDGAGTDAIQNRWNGLYVDWYDKSQDTWTVIYNTTDMSFDNTGTWPLEGDDGFGPYIGKRMVCDSDRCLHFWVDEFGQQGVIQIYGKGDFQDPDVRNFIPSGNILGRNLRDINDGGAYITGFAESTNGDFEYYAMRGVGTGTGTPDGFVAKVDTQNLLGGGHGEAYLASGIYPYVVTIQGLRADPLWQDDIYFSLIPSSLKANTTANPWCPYKTNSTGPNYAFKSDDGDSVNPVDGETPINNFALGISGVKAHSYTICNYELYRTGSGGLAKIYSDQVNRWSDSVVNDHRVSAGNTRPDYGLIVAPAISWSIGEFDEFGNYYTAYIDSMCLGSSGSCLSTTGQWRVFCCPDYRFTAGDNYPWPNSDRLTMTYAIFQEDKGVRFPMLSYYDDVSVLGSVDYPNPLSNGIGLRKQISTSGVDINFCDDTNFNHRAGEGGEPGDPGCMPVGTNDATELSLAYGQKSNWYTIQDSILQWGQFQGTTERLTVGATTFNTPVYAIMGSTSLVSEGFTELGCYVSSFGGPLSKIGGSIVDITDCPAQMLSSDVDRDGTDEVVLAKGIYEWNSGERTTSFNQGETSSFGIVDFTSDSYLDMVFVTTNVVRHLVSLGDLNVQYSDQLGIHSLACTYDSNTGEVSVDFIGVSTENPDALVFFADMYEEGNAVKVSSVGAQSDSTITFKPRATGNHEINGFVQDTITGEQVGQTCVFNVPTLPAGGVVTFANISTDLTCSIEPAGEFNYDSSVQSYDWFIDQNGREPVLDGAKATFNKQDINMLHGLACEDPQMSATIRIQPTETTNFKLIIQAEDWGIRDYSGVATDWITEYVGGLWFYEDEIWVWDDGDSPRKILDNFAPGVFYEVALTFNRDSSVYTVSLDGVVIEEVNLWNGQFKGKYIAVIARSLEGTTYVDYIRTEGLTGSAEEILLPGEVSDEVLQYSLSNCREDLTDEDFRDFQQNPVGNVSYTNVNSWCNNVGTDTGEQTICEFDDLQEAVRINPDCYQEAFTYCVEVTYPLTAGFQDPNDIEHENIRSEQGVDLNGAAACSIALQTQSAGDSLFSPLWNLLWRGSLANPIFAMVIVFVIVISIAIYAKRK